MLNLKVIKEYRKKKGRTLEQLAEKMGVSRSALSKIERGEVDYINIELLDRIVKELGIPKSKLIK